MGDDDDSGSSTPGRRAPWERPISRVPRSDQDSGPRPPVEPVRPDSPTPPDSRPRPDDPRPVAPTPSPPSDDEDKRLSVAELVDKVSKIASSRNRRTDDHPTRSAPPEPDAETDPPTVVIPPVPAPSREISDKDRPAPEAVGPIPPPALTRLALSRARKRRRVRVFGRIGVSMVSILALLVTGVVWGYLRATDRGFEQVAALDTESTDVVDAPGQYGDETYLIVGTDTRAGASGEIGAGTEADAEGARSDTVMLINIPADRSRVVAVSFPRDLDVERPECEGWNSTTGDYTGEMFPAADGDKLNATYALGGPKCLVKIIQKISGLRIGHFVGIDFAGFESMVNEVGGVDVCTPVPLVDDELGTVLATTGEQRIDGRTALNYVRARKVEAEGTGDYGRIKRQQLFLSSLLRSVLSNRVLFDPGALNGFVTAFTRDTFVENVKTSDLLTLGKSLRGVAAGAVTFLTVPTSGTTDYGNEIPRTDDIKAIFQAIIDDQPLPGEERAAEVPGAPVTTAPPITSEPQIAVDPSTVSVQISNGSEISGLAATTADELAAYGFQIMGTGNAEVPGSAATVVRYGTGSIAEAETVASAIPGAVLEELPSLGGIVDVVLGSEYQGFTSVPTAVGEVLPTFQVGTSGATEVALPSDLTVTNGADDACV
ncbi:LytR family transcriptional regulator [Rhodococcus sp. Leaf7]|uniref:LCP family protein n=1 Tax=unclassified Rhodococcus (in: high G+C Gram-positive bacteria) TaxID=192944 RepID=UPI0006F6915E|nr:MULTISPECIES: LCP family protein [unclassified Rhodococcus (in: high G+C Gram-positive bacteria)]KQU06866.1 LytR family transcriptional regulator [Rhodococcus sp. Leaf7]KQU42385.1 LytR family transcriptional regulator [Rhodococcus sp. Leaf247]